MSWGIIGGGFGLYGYLPALAEEPSCGQITTLERYRSFIRSRNDIAKYEGRVKFVKNESELLAYSDQLVIAKRPQDQEELVALISLTGWRGSLLLEKPLARNPSKADLLIDCLRSAKVGFSIGYTLIETNWAREIQTLFANSDPDCITISWKFRAHHYSNDLSSWKRYPKEGGGALRFYCNHLVAFLSDLGEWVPVKCSSWPIDQEDSFCRFQLQNFNCITHVECDSTWEGPPRFEISVAKNSHLLFEFKGRDPFDHSDFTDTQDSRIKFLQNILRRLEAGHFLSFEKCKKQVSLWDRIEKVREN